MGRACKRVLQNGRKRLVKCIVYLTGTVVNPRRACPLPRIDMTLDLLSGSHWFTTLSGYWQVEMAGADKDITAFCTTEGLFQFRVMPFVLCNTPATFQTLMDVVLSGLQWSQCLVYLDDIIVLGHSFGTCPEPWFCVPTAA